ncbi:zinc finger protein 665-like isoform X1 [Uranotaenia lowii]|uniref:zinc finger protein 665-like isoform X1 n=1 Tax=Uranotaenia lowii TaxID=190385 RepID=UPI00247A0CDD|nr:zinc finger protein 665-like isoform X1 [Uranotaenia lowii]
MSSDEDTPVVKRPIGRPRKIPSPAKGKRPDEDMDGKHYACQVCDQVFLHKANFLRHSTRHEEPGGFVCVICHMPFTTDWDRNKHKREAHSVYRCRICSDEFPVEQDYNDHIVVEHEGKDRDYEVCEHCGQNFRTTSQLKVHIESNCGTQKRFKCETCGQRYLSQASLNAHSIKHQADTGILCNYCGASFNNKGQLKVHERTHTGEKPYKCTQCDKAFAHRESLITHSTTHSGVKPYHCSYCDNRFSCIGNLLKHRRARPDTCGLPQYCQTNKKVDRPTSKTLPSLTERHSTASKVIQRSGGLRNLQSSPESKPKIQRLMQFKQDEDDSDDDEPDFQPDDDSDEEVDRKSPSKVMRLKTQGDKKHQLVNLKVESYESEEASTSDIPIKIGKRQAEEPLETLELEVSEIKIESGITYEEVTGEEILEETIFYEDSYSQSASELLIETEHFEPERKIRQKKTPVRKERHPRDIDNDEEEDDEDYNVNDDDDKGSEEEYVQPKVRKVFTEKPPVITNPRRRGRQRIIRPPKEVNENVVMVDIEAQQREIEAQQSLFEASVISTELGAYRCQHCLQQQTSMFIMGRHLDQVHGISVEKYLATQRWNGMRPRDRNLQCKLCGRIYSSAGRLKSHIPLHGPDGNLIHRCEHCPTWYATEEEATNHAQEVHLNELYCQLCDRKFSRIAQVKRHHKTTHGDPADIVQPKVKQYICDKCCKKFKAKQSLLEHKEADCGLNPTYECDTCGKLFLSNRILKKHARIHGDEFPFLCQFCDKRFLTKVQVTVHERCHTGEKPYECTFCAKRFAHHESLATHLSQHTGIRRYMCSGCGSRFSCVSGLQSHRKTHPTTCGLVPTLSKSNKEKGYHELPEDYIYPYPENLKNINF